MTHDIPRSNAPLFPVRGIIPVRNARGHAFATRDLHRWIRVSRNLDKVLKIDLLAHGEFPPHLPLLFAYGMPPLDGFPQDQRPPCQVALSLRTDCAGDPGIMPRLQAVNLLDVFLTPRDPGSEAFTLWLDACQVLGVRMRVQLMPPFNGDFKTTAFVDRLSDAGVEVFSLVLEDPFLPRQRHVKVPGDRTMKTLNELAAATVAAGIETSLFGMPMCHIHEELRVNAGGHSRFALDSQNYHPGANERAARLFRRHPALVGMVMAAYLGRQNADMSVVDSWLVENLVHNNRHGAMLALMLLSKVVRGFGFMQKTPGALPPEGAPQPPEADEVCAAGPECRECALRRVCDGPTAAVGRMLPGLRVARVTGPPVPSPVALLARQPKREDTVDRERRTAGSDLAELAEKARRVMLDSPAKAFDFDDIRPENAFSKRMPGAYRYMTLVDRELISTRMFHGEPPVTLAITFGGGLADYVGFLVSGWIRLVCPMEDASHQVVLHVEADGRYVLLRDGEPVLPVEFAGRHYVPRRLPTGLDVRLSMWNVEGGLCTQNPQVWAGAPDADERKERVRHSVVVFCTRYARRLQAALQGVAHQSGMEEGSVEVVVGYVPGIDATDDVISSIQQAHPGLRVVRCPFTEHNINSKGRILNTALAMASGAWVTIIDADIVMPPVFFQRLDALGDDALFAAPMGRKMLTPEATARVLLGESAPWRDWDAVLAGPGEDRFGDRREGGEIPVGFCQCVRKTCLDTVRYNEYDHFEGADWEFGRDMIEVFGPCRWLDVPVLHLDHGGSQWFGTRLQR
jgi:hypothetical protein